MNQSMLTSQKMCTFHGTCFLTAFSFKNRHDFCCCFSKRLKSLNDCFNFITTYFVGMANGAAL